MILENPDLRAIHEAVFNSFQNHANPKNAIAMKAYMQHKFNFYGIMKPKRVELVAFLKPEVKKLPINLVKILAVYWWQLPQREWQYLAMWLLDLHQKKLNVSDLPTIEHLISNNAWWDTVDLLASKNVGNMLIHVPPETRKQLINKYAISSDMWLNRTAIIFQLHYKQETDSELLFNLCAKFANEKAFFIRKAIGWALRQYAKFNPEAVIAFTKQNNLSKLSEKEALRLLKQLA